MKKITTDEQVDKIVEKIRNLPQEKRDEVLSELLYIKASGLLEKKKHADVLKTISPFLKKDPEAMGFLALKFRACIKLKKVHLAKRVLITMSKIDRDAKMIDSRFSWPATQTPFYDEALPFLKQVIKKNVKNPVPIETKGRILAILGRHDEVLALMEWAYKIEPRNHSALIFREYFLYLIGRRGNPIDDINGVIKRTGTKNKKMLSYRDSVIANIMEIEKSR